MTATRSDLILEALADVLAESTKATETFAERVGPDATPEGAAQATLTGVILAMADRLSNLPTGTPQDGRDFIAAVVRAGEGRKVETPLVLGVSFDAP